MTPPRSSPSHIAPFDTSSTTGDAAGAAAAYLVKASDEVPVLHMSYQAPCAGGAAAALADLGVFIVDARRLGGLAYAAEVGRLVSEPSPRCGILTYAIKGV